MPSKSLNLDTSHLQYIEDYADDHGLSDSEAARELLDKGIEMEERGSDVL